jgi:glycosyltransferase involved in cell wall biosynthesis
MSKVSIVVPCYNYGNYLSEALTSLEKQVYDNLECIVVDDGSTDNTKNVALSFCERDNRFKYIYQNNKGLSEARNTGIRHSTGEFIQFLDSDDILGKNKIYRQVSMMNKYPEVDIVYGRFKYFDVYDNIVNEEYFDDDKWSPKISGKGEKIIEKLLIFNISEVGSFIFRKNIIHKVGFFDISYRSLEDWNYWMRCALESANFYYDDNLDGLFYMRKGHQSMQANSDVMKKSRIQLNKSFINELKHYNVNTKLLGIAKKEYINILSKTKTFDYSILVDKEMVLILITKIINRIIKALRQSRLLDSHN